MWTIKPQTIYVLGGRMKIEFRAGASGDNQHARHHVMDITQLREDASHGVPTEGVTCRVRFSAGGEVIRIEKLTPDPAARTQGT